MKQCRFLFLGVDKHVNVDKVGWPVDSHGAPFYQGDKPSGLSAEPYDVSMPIMARWYTKVFSELAGVRLGNG